VWVQINFCPLYQDYFLIDPQGYDPCTRHSMPMLPRAKCPAPDKKVTVSAQSSESGRVCSAIAVAKVQRRIPAYLIITWNTMKSLTFGLLATGVLSQAFEPIDFNITEALLDNGVNVTALPDLAPLIHRSLLNGCSTAVSHQ
jgi:hypothetical protein